MADSQNISNINNFQNALIESMLQAANGYKWSNKPNLAIFLSREHQNITTLPH